MESIQTRLPAYLWESLQDVFYEWDHAFLQDIAPLVGVSAAELRRTILGGSRGLQTRVIAARTDRWWEGELCPLRVRLPSGVWKGCGGLRESHGACCAHQGWKPSDTLKHRDDAYFERLQSRKPFRYDGTIVWVAEDGSVVNDQGRRLRRLRIDPKTGFLQFLSSPSSEEGATQNTGSLGVSASGAMDPTT